MLAKTVPKASTTVATMVNFVPRGEVPARQRDEKRLLAVR